MYGFRKDRMSVHGYLKGQGLVYENRESVVLVNENYLQY